MQFVFVSMKMQAALEPAFPWPKSDLNIMSSHDADNDGVCLVSVSVCRVEAGDQTGILIS